MADDQFYSASDLDALRECPICFEMYTELRRRPKLLPCGHTMCRKCLNDLVRVSMRVQCPVDREFYQMPPEGVDALADNFALMSLFDVLPVTRCGLCGETRRGRTCKHCRKVLCSECMDSHVKDEVDEPDSPSGVTFDLSALTEGVRQLGEAVQLCDRVREGVKLEADQLKVSITQVVDGALSRLLCRKRVLLAEVDKVCLQDGNLVREFQDELVVRQACIQSFLSSVDAQKAGGEAVTEQQGAEIQGESEKHARQLMEMTSRKCGSIHRLVFTCDSVVLGNIDARVMVDVHKCAPSEYLSYLMQKPAVVVEPGPVSASNGSNSVSDTVDPSPRNSPIAVSATVDPSQSISPSSVTVLSATPRRSGRKKERSSTSSPPTGQPSGDVINLLSPSQQHRGGGGGGGGGGASVESPTGSPRQQQQSGSHTPPRHVVPPAIPNRTHPGVPLDAASSRSAATTWLSDATNMNKRPSALDIQTVPVSSTAHAARVSSTVQSVATPESSTAHSMSYSTPLSSTVQSVPSTPVSAMTQYMSSAAPVYSAAQSFTSATPASVASVSSTRASSTRVHSRSSAGNSSSVPPVSRSASLNIEAHVSAASTNSMTSPTAPSSLSTVPGMLISPPEYTGRRSAGLQPDLTPPQYAPHCDTTTPGATTPQYTPQLDIPPGTAPPYTPHPTPESTTTYPPHSPPPYETAMYVPPTPEAIQEQLEIYKMKKIPRRMMGDGRGSRPGKFCSPFGVAIAPDGNVAVADTNNHRVQLFDSKGQFIRAFGSYGARSKQFICPFDVAISDAGSIFVSDCDNRCIKIFSGTCSFQHKFTCVSVRTREAFRPSEIALDPAQKHLYVCDNDHSQVHRFTIEGVPVMSFGSKGRAPGKFVGVDYIATGPCGEIVVSDTYNHRVQVFDDHGHLVRVIGSHGEDNGCFIEPHGVAVDQVGLVLVADKGQGGRVQVLSLTGEHLWTVPSRVTNPEGLALGPNGYLVVVDGKKGLVTSF